MNVDRVQAPVRYRQKCTEWPLNCGAPDGPKYRGDQAPKPCNYIRGDTRSTMSCRRGYFCSFIHDHTDSIEARKLLRCLNFTRFGECQYKVCPFSHLPIQPWEIGEDPNVRPPRRACNVLTEYENSVIAKMKQKCRDNTNQWCGNYNYKCFSEERGRTCAGIAEGTCPYKHPSIGEFVGDGQPPARRKRALCKNVNRKTGDGCPDVFDKVSYCGYSHNIHDSTDARGGTNLTSWNALELHD